MNILVYSLQMKAIEDSVSKLQEFVKENYEEIVIEIVQDSDVFTEMICELTFRPITSDINDRTRARW